MKLASVTASLVLGLTVISTSSLPTTSEAYPIDCAILLCLAGGFPASAECSAAKAELIRRITPFPIEPPLQLWRCPMSIPAGLATSLGLATAGVGPDGLTAEVRQYRDDIEIYHISYYGDVGSGDSRETWDHARKGQYDLAGDFRWVSASYENGPAWLAEATGGYSYQVRMCERYGRYDDLCESWKTVGSKNAHRGWRLRGVAIRYRTHDGQYHAEWVKY